MLLANLYKSIQQIGDPYASWIIETLQMIAESPAFVNINDT